MIATTGVFTILVEIGFLRYGSDTVFVPPFLPNGVGVDRRGATVGVDRFILLGIAVVLTVVLWLVYRYTRFGLATSAVAENELTAGALGISPDRVALLNWTIGSALAGGRRRADLLDRGTEPAELCLARRARTRGGDDRRDSVPSR